MFIDCRLWRAALLRPGREGVGCRLDRYAGLDGFFWNIAGGSTVIILIAVSVHRTIIVIVVTIFVRILISRWRVFLGKVILPIVVIIVVISPIVIIVLRAPVVVLIEIVSIIPVIVVIVWIEAESIRGTTELRRRWTVLPSIMWREAGAVEASVREEWTSVVYL